jgi:hypothetical protein
MATPIGGDSTPEIIKACSSRITQQTAVLPRGQIKDVIPAEVVGAQRHDHRPIAGRNLSYIHKLEAGVIRGWADVVDGEIFSVFRDGDD